MSEQTRPPIVTILGHVDHGKTTLLDFIRKANVAAREHGGITQAIGAYQVRVQGTGDRGQKEKITAPSTLHPDPSNTITFIDTPGHAAFEKMRSRGAKVADIAVLVVAADDGVMPQTIEAIKHILAAKVSMIVAVNKIDIPGINLTTQMEKIKRQLSDNNVLVEEYGGDVPIIQLSAKTGDGVDKLLEMILLVAEVNEIKGDPSLPAQGVVIESNLDKSKGAVATVIIRNGTLTKKDQIILGGISSKIRGILDYTGKPVDTAGPSTPVELLGLEVVPTVGAVLGEDAQVVAKQQVESLVEKLRNEGQEKITVIAKADKAGSLEAVEDALMSFNTEKETVKLVSKGTGDITEKDVEMAAATKAIILGFGIKVTPAAQRVADNEHVLIRTYNIIYELLDELKDVVEGMLSGELQEEIFGVGQIIAEFQYGKMDRIAGTKVLDGNLSKGPKVRIVRKSSEEDSENGEVIGEGKIKSIKHLKEEVSKVEKGQECGILFDPPIDFKVGDIIQSYRAL